jgi:hypothetical protein
VQLSDGEKLLAIMMSDICKHLKLKGEIDSEFVVGAIAGGHYNWALAWKMPGLYHDEDDPTEVQFVRRVLGMWTFLERAH